MAIRTRKQARKQTVILTQLPTSYVTLVKSLCQSGKTLSPSYSDLIGPGWDLGIYVYCNKKISGLFSAISRLKITDDLF